MKLFGEEIYSEVTMLTGLSGGGDANDLARTTLKDQQVANANVVAWDRDGVWPTATFDVTDTFTHPFTYTRGTTLFSINCYFFTLGAMMMGMERMKDAVGSFFKTVTERMIASRVVVVSHTGPTRCFYAGLGFDLDFFSDFFAWNTATFVFDVVCRLHAGTITTLGKVKLGLTIFGFTTGNLDIDLGVDEFSTRFSIAKGEKKV